MIKINYVVLMTLFLTLLNIASAQKLAEPHLLGEWFGGEDPSEFLLHRVLETSESLLKENPRGRLIVRICSTDNFALAFVKTTLNPMSVDSYNSFRLPVPRERIFVSRTSACVCKQGFSHTQYWFVPVRTELEYDEIVPIAKSDYKSFFVFEDPENKKTQQKDFEKEVVQFMLVLKNDLHAQGLIVHNRKNKSLRHNIRNLMSRLTVEAIELNRISVVERPEPIVEGEKPKNSYPTLVALRIKTD